MNCIHSILQIFKVPEFKSKLYHLKECRTCHPKICHFGIVIILSWGHWKNSRCRERFFPHSSFWLKTDLPKGTQLSSIRLTRFPSARKGWLVTVEEARCRHHNQKTWSQTMISPISSCKVPFIFQKIIYSSLRGLHSSSPSPVKTVYKLSNLTVLGYSPCYSCDAPGHIILKINTCVCLFSC